MLQEFWVHRSWFWKRDWFEHFVDHGSAFEMPTHASFATTATGYEINRFFHVNSSFFFGYVGHQCYHLFYLS